MFYCLVFVCVHFEQSFFIWFFFSSLFYPWLEIECLMDKEMRYRKFRHNVDYLVRRLQDGDEYAFAFFLDTYGESLYFFANKAFISHDKSEVPRQSVARWCHQEPRHFPRPLPRVCVVMMFPHCCSCARLHICIFPLPKSKRVLFNTSYLKVCL